MGILATLSRDPLFPIAAIVGAPGAQGASGAPTRFDAGPAATWTIVHGLGRVPQVGPIHLNSGEAVLADVVADAVYITVTFATAQQGFVLAS